MGFLSPWSLLALFALLPIALAYRRELLRRGGSAAVHPDLPLLERAGGLEGRRHLAAGLYLAAVGVAVAAIARPTAPMPVPDPRGGVMLALETSFSMYNSDIAPSRLEAMKITIRRLVRGLPEGVPVGLASFAGHSVLNVPLTTDRARVLEALDGLEMAGGVAFGLGLREAVEAFPEPTKPGDQGGANVVLVSHGHDFSGQDPMAVADEAARRGIKVFAVGVGTHNYNFDDEPLKHVADRTGGQYYSVQNAGALDDAGRRLERLVGWRLAPGEVTALVALVAAGLLAASLGASGLRRRVV